MRMLHVCFAYRCTRTVQVIYVLLPLLLQLQNSAEDTSIDKYP